MTTTAVETTKPVAAQNAQNRRRLIPWIVISALIVLAVFLLWRAHGFYTMHGQERVMHPEFGSLKASGRIGQGYGVFGTILIVANLLYLVRRRLAKFSFGSLRTWLDLHVACGLAGALLVAFHSTFQLRTPIATTTALSLAVLVLTGAVGLYIYRLVPKTGGLKFQQRVSAVENVFPDFAKRVRVAIGGVPCTRLSANAGFWRLLITLPRWTTEARARREAVQRVARHDPSLLILSQVEREVVDDLVFELSDLAASEIDANAGAALMRSWRSLHGFMAILMVVCVTVHIAVAWFYGYRWLFSK